MTKLKTVPDREKYDWLKPGDVLLSYNKHSILGRLILFFMNLRRKSGKAKYSHAMIHIGDGFIISSEFKVRIVPFEYAQKNADRMKVLRHTGLTELSRKTLSLNAVTYYGEDYDFLHLIGFMLWSLTGWSFFRRKLHIRYEEVCSTLVAKVYKSIGVYFDSKRDKNVTPDEIDQWCSDSQKWTVIDEWDQTAKE